MAEIFSFNQFEEARKKKLEQEREKVKENEQNNSPDNPLEDREDIGDERKRASIFFLLDEDVRKMFVDRMREVGKSQKAGHMFLSERQLNAQRDLVRGWSNKEVIQFLRNSKNIEHLKVTPHLLFALFERVIGKL